MREIITIVAYKQFVKSNTDNAITLHGTSIRADMGYRALSPMAKLMFFNALLISNKDGKLYHTFSDNPYTAEELIRSVSSHNNRNDLLGKAFLELIHYGLIHSNIKYDRVSKIAHDKYSTDWTEDLRMAVRKRDGYKCRVCSKDGIQVHHIDYNKSNCDPGNLVTLCSRCHNKTNIRREYWKKYFTERKDNARHY